MAITFSVTRHSFTHEFFLSSGIRRANRGDQSFLESYLRCFAVDQPRSWSLWVPWAEFWYNTTFHESTGISPFEAVYGRKPPNVCQFLLGEVRVETVRQELKDRDEAIKQLRNHLLQAQSQMKEQADKKRRDVEFRVGELVYVKLRPYR